MENFDACGLSGLGILYYICDFAILEIRWDEMDMFWLSSWSKLISKSSWSKMVSCVNPSRL